MASQTLSATPVALARCLGGYRGGADGMMVVGVGGIHGNEPAGVFALKRVLRELETARPSFRGELVALAGNLSALAHGTRYVDYDLNRIWQPERIRALKAGVESAPRSAAEQIEQRELLEQIEQAVRRSMGPVIFLDLHTISSDGAPFAVISDTLTNRRLAANLRVPVVLGLEESLDGTFLNYVNDLGHPAIGFEGGPHGSPASVKHHEAAIWLTLVAAGCVSRAEVPHLAQLSDLLASRAEGLPPVTEVRYRHAILEGERFVMAPAYTNFEPVMKGQLLARDVHGEIRAREDGRVFMPLYQKQGADGFFLVQEVSPFWLNVARWMRRMRLDLVLPFLPGVRRDAKRADTFLVNPRVARWGVRHLFHLLGFRRQQCAGGRLQFSRRREPSASI